ncbi:FAD:protein FMN transferase [Shewanella sp. WPAGA9]|uniref:FAD:protein FMN transferase n=1 Tax=Shewanella sp. ENK2 TaxID=2775245 RepID=UPI00177DD0D3|nr:FAD:protein FMN transferase [Shewanella sp. WPAGA9]
MNIFKLVLLSGLLTSNICYSTGASQILNEAISITDKITDKYSDEIRNEFYQCDSNALITVTDNLATLHTVKYFGTTISIDVFNLPQGTEKQVLCNALNVIQEYHYLASNYSTYPHVTNIKTINNTPNVVHHIDPQLSQLIASSIDWHEKSHGYFNIALSPVIDLWRQKRFECDKNQGKDCSTPTKNALDNASQFTDIKQINFNPDKKTIVIKPGMSLDLGGIAKGWMTEKVFTQLRLDGASQFMINAGGNIRHLGLHPENRQFVTAIEDPLCKKSQYQLPQCASFEGQYHELITGQNITVVSSGNYLRYFEVNGKQYHHLIDPKTNYPKPEGVATTVVLKGNQIFADVLSTTLFLMPLEEAIEYVNNNSFIEAVWYLDEEGNKIKSDNFNSVSK